MEALSGVYLLGLSFTILVHCVAANPCDPNPCPNRLACSPMRGHVRCGEGYIEETSDVGAVKKSLKNPLGVDGYEAGEWYNTTGSTVDGNWHTDTKLGVLDLLYRHVYGLKPGYDIDKTNGNLIINKVEKYHDGIYMVAMLQPEPRLYMYAFIRLQVPGPERTTRPGVMPNNGGNDIKLCAELIVAYLVFTVFAHYK